MATVSTDLRYPIGPFRFDGDVSPARRAARVDDIAAAPAALRVAVRGLDDRQLDTPYRPGGWTVRQVVHHVPDSHMNAYIRMKLCVTEDVPTIKPYDEKTWAELPDGRGGPVERSLVLLETLHERWVRFLRALPAEAFGRTVIHPESGIMSLDALVAMYAWHGKHHAAQVTALRERSGW
jgi:uncharacterized damage-inducible protein DinB